jgi:hypothetical protein
MALCNVIRDSLMEFAQSIPESAKYSREYELVSRYVFGHLLKAVNKDSQLQSPSQIGLNVAVPQKKELGGMRKHPDVCKDLVIWTEPGIVCWDGDGKPDRFPLAVLEWTTLNRKDSRQVKKVKRGKKRSHDIDWLRWLVEQNEGTEGFAVLIDLADQPVSINVVRIARADYNDEWVNETFTFV